VTALDEAAALIQRGSRFLVGAHARPDGDALGSMLATMHGLRALGKTAIPWSRDRASEYLAGLPGARELTAKIDGTFDGVFLHDLSDAALLNDNFPAREITGPVVILDHHATSKPFGDIVVRDSSASAVGVIVARLLSRLGVAIDKNIAECLWCSLASDTGWFRYPATDVETLRLAADCVAAGAQPWAFARATEEEEPVERLQLLREVLKTLVVVGEPPRRCAFLTVSDTELSAARAQPDMSEGFVNYARGLKAVEVGVLLADTRRGVRVSLRSKGGIDVSAIAAAFGGGGHHNAAGCLLPIPVDEARKVIAEAVAAAPVKSSRPSPPPDGAR
jgi:phosphoesterase RecJ-like protein